MTWLVAIALAGTIPSALPAPVRVLWITAAGYEAPAGCALQGPSGWTCDELPAEPRGLVVIVDVSGSLAYLPIGALDGPGGGVAGWGRVVQVVPGGVALENLHALHVSAWKPERPRYRALSRRFSAVEDESIHVLQLSDTVFWVAGQPTDVDAYIQFDGPAIATSRLLVSALSQGPPEWSIVHAVDAPFAMIGQVQTRRGDNVEGATVELFEPLHPLLPGAMPRLPEPLIRRAATVSHADGTFTFDRLEPGRYHVSVVDPWLGRGDVDVRSLAEPIEVRLVPALVVKGRVLRSSLPVSDARVRFVPDTSALVASTNPEDHITEEVTTATDGRFLLPLPPDPTGAVQVIGTDGASVRVPLTELARDRDISLGDIVLPEPRRVGIRLANGDGCTLSAVGPLGHLGLSTVQATVVGISSWLDLPEGGDWALTAQCDGKSRDVLPRILVVPQAGPDLFVDARLVR